MMDESNKQNMNLQPCQNPLERKIFKVKRRKPEGEPEINTRLFQQIYNELDKLRNELAENKEQFQETYSQVILENIKAYLSEVLTSRESRAIQTTVSFVTANSKITYFQNNNSRVQQIQPIKKKVKEQKSKQQPYKSVYQSILSQNTSKLRKYKY